MLLPMTLPTAMSPLPSRDAWMLTAVSARAGTEGDDGQADDEWRYPESGCKVRRAAHQGFGSCHQQYQAGNQVGERQQGHRGSL